MASKNSAGSTPWTWVIEALAGFDKVYTSLLIDLVKQLPPDIPDDLGKKTREAVSARILKDLSTNTTTTDKVPSPSESKIGFQSSKRCQDILFSLLDGSLGSKGRLPEVDMSKHDVEPFVKQKQSSLPKSNLQVLKDLILQGNHLLLAPLKKRSGLVIPPEPEKDLDPNDKTDSNGVTERIEGYIGKCQPETAIQDLSSLSSESRPFKNSIPAERGRRIEGESIENHGIMIDECESYLNPTKKHKSDVPVCQSSPQRTELVESQCPRNLPRKENSSPDGSYSPCSDEEVPRDKSG